MNSKYEDIRGKMGEFSRLYAKEYFEIGGINEVMIEQISRIPNVIFERGNTEYVMQAFQKGIVSRLEREKRLIQYKALHLTDEQIAKMEEMEKQKEEAFDKVNLENKSPEAPYIDKDFKYIMNLAYEGHALSMVLGSKVIKDFDYTIVFEFFGKDRTVEKLIEIENLKELTETSEVVSENIDELLSKFRKARIQCHMEVSNGESREYLKAVDDFSNLMTFFELVAYSEKETIESFKKLTKGFASCREHFNLREFNDRRGNYMSLIANIHKVKN